MRDLAFIAAWVVLLPLVFRGGAHLGVLLWTWTSLLAPNDVLYGAGVSVPFSKLAAIPALVLLVTGRGGGMQIRFNRTTWIVAGLALVGLISQSMTVMADPAPGWELFQKYIKILLLCAIVTWTMRDRLRIHALLFAICLGLGFTGVGEGAKFLLSGGGHKVLGTASTGDNNQVALDVLLMLPMLQYLYATARTRLLRLGCLGGGLMTVICVIATASRGGFAGLLIVAVATVLTSRRKLQGLLLIAAMGLVGSQLVSDDWTARMNTIQTAAEDDDSFLGRVTAWKVATAEAVARPLTGGGFHAAQHGEVWFRYGADIGWLDAIPSAPIEYLHAAHSIYFEILGDLGFPGLLLFLLLFWFAWVDAGRVRAIVRRSGRTDLAWAATLALKLRVSILVFMVCGGLLSAAYYDIEYLVVALLTVLRDLVEREVREPRSADGSIAARPVAAGLNPA